MTLLKEINELHISLRSFIISILILMPFWFVAIFLFHKEFFNSTPLYVIIVFTFCFSLVNYIIFHVFIDNVKENLDSFQESKRKGANSKVLYLFFVSSALCLMWICIMMLCGFIFKWNFYLFLKWLFIPIGFVGFISTISKPKKKPIKPINKEDV